MEPLTTRDTRRLLEFVRDLYELRDSDGFKQQVVHGLATLVSADLYAYNEISPSRKLVTGYAIWPKEFPLLKDAPDIVGRYQHQHPTVMHYLTTGEGDVTRISDFMTYREFRRTDLHNEFYRPMGIPYGIGFGLSLSQDSLIGIGLHRSGKDYTERDRRVLSELHPHIRQAYENAQAVTRLQHGTAAIHDALDALGSAVICLTPSSTIRWMTPLAERLLLRYHLLVPRQPDHLHQTITGWLQAQEAIFSTPTALPHALHPLVIRGPEGTMTIRLMRHGQFHLLVLDETRPSVPRAALAGLGLSARETEILGWVMHGKTSPEIATILGISPRTVHKHLERIYQKLGVENRHSAMRVVMEARRGG